MAKIKDSVWWIFGNSIKLYFENFGSLFRYMAFPVFGQLVGMILIIFASYYYSINIEKAVSPDALASNFSMVFLVLFIVTLPGFLILIKAFWEYLVAYGAINSMIDNMMKSGRVYDFHAHNEIISRRSASYGVLWGTLAFIAIIAIFPLFWLVAGILFFYFILVFQIFAFEPQQSVIGCYKRSFTLIKGNFARTVGLTCLIGGLTYSLLPEVVKYLLSFTGIIKFLAIPFDGWAMQLPINNINTILSNFNTGYQINSLMIAECIVTQLLIYLVTSLLLPMRVICWGLWYKNLNKGEMKLDKRILDRAEKNV